MNHNCGQSLEAIARSMPKQGSPNIFVEFYQCTKCDKVYYKDTRDGVIKEYAGRFSADDIKMVIPKLKYNCARPDT